MLITASCVRKLYYADPNGMARMGYASPNTSNTVRYGLDILCRLDVHF